MSDAAEWQPKAGWGSVIVLALASAAYALAQTAVLPGLGALSRALTASPADISWVMSAYLLSAAILTPVFGRLGDMLGKRRMLVTVLAIFTLGSVVAAMATDIWTLVAARVVQGAGGGIIPLCLGIISDSLPPRKRPAALGLISAIAGIGAGGGLLMGGLLVDHASWHWIFWSGAVTAGLATLGAARLPDGGVRSPGRIDVPGILLLAVGLIAPLFALTRTSTWGWADTRTLGLIAAGLVVLVLFVLYERRVAEPLVDMRVLGRPVVLVTNLTTLLFGFGMFGAFVLIPQLAQTPAASGYGFGLDATGAGLLLLPACLTMLVTGGLAGRLGLRYGPKVPLTAGALIAAAGLAGLAAAHGSQGAVIAWSVVLFTGIGLGMAAMPNLIVGGIPRDKTGEGTAVNALIRSVGSSLGSQVVATLLAGSVTVARPLPTDGAYGQAFWLGAGAIMVAAIAAFLIPRGPSPTPSRLPGSTPRTRTAPSSSRLVAMPPVTPEIADWSDRRADARRNHERVIAAAIEVFAERGLEATVPEVAARAGVGKATVYRSYPTKADLIAAVARHQITWLSQRIAAAAREPDAFTALSDLLGDMAERLAGDRVLAAVLPKGDRLTEDTGPAEDLARVIAAAQRQGRLRADVSIEDVRVLLGGCSRVLIERGIHDPAQWRRYAGLVLNALRP